MRGRSHPCHLKVLLWPLVGTWPWKGACAGPWWLVQPPPHVRLTQEFSKPLPGPDPRPRKFDSLRVGLGTGMISALPGRLIDWGAEDHWQRAKDLQLLHPALSLPVALSTQQRSHFHQI